MQALDELEGETHGSEQNNEKAVLISPGCSFAVCHEKGLGSTKTTISTERA